MPYGYNGKILRVNLTNGKITTEEPGELVYRKYLGGGTLGLYYLINELKPLVDPLGPENILIFSTSVATGGMVAGLNRYSVVAKSPLTGGFGESEAGGYWAPELKSAGFDAIIIEGKAKNPVYLWIHDGKVEIRDAAHLWGKTTGEVQETIREELGDKLIRVAQIGKAGENLIRFACISNDLTHFNGRAGLGAVMGSKNLRAIAVRGHRKIEYADREAILSIVKSVKETHDKDPSVWSSLGTAGVTLSLNELGMLPTRNFHYGAFEGAEEIGGERLKETILVGSGTCRACFIRCKREVKVEEPYQVDPLYGGPEYETIAALGSLLEIGDLKAISRANQLCGMYGMDTISLGTTIAFAMECYEEGILTEKDTSGIDLRFGNSEALLETIEMVVKREGIGDILAEGVKSAAERIGKGSEKYALHVKGQPLPMHEPRGKKGLALAYALSPTGADHLEHPHDPCFETDELMKNVHPLGLLDQASSMDLSEKKVRLFVYLQHYYNLVNSIGMCLLTLQPYTNAFSITNLLDLIRVITGWDTSLWEMMKVGERFSNMARIFNLREGITSADDILPNRLFEPLKGGVLKGEKLDREEFFEARRAYYGMMGWDPDTGIPSRYKVMELDLDWLMEALNTIESSDSNKTPK